MRQVDEGSDVELENFELSIEIEFGKVSPRSEARVVDEHLDLELALLCLFKQLRRSVMLLQIEREVLRANGGQTSQFVEQRDELVFRASDEEHVSATRGELARKCGPDARRCSSDDGGVHEMNIGRPIGLIRPISAQEDPTRLCLKY